MSSIEEETDLSPLAIAVHEQLVKMGLIPPGKSSIFATAVIKRAIRCAILQSTSHVTEVGYRTSDGVVLMTNDVQSDFTPPRGAVKVTRRIRHLPIIIVTQTWRKA